MERLQGVYKVHYCCIAVISDTHNYSAIPRDQSLQMIVNKYGYTENNHFEMVN